MNGEGIVAFLHVDAAGGEPLRHGPQAVALLDPQLRQALHARRPLGGGGGHGEDGILVDHGGRPAPRHLHAAQGTGADRDVGHRLAPNVALVGEADVGPHVLEGFQESGAQGIDADAGELDGRSRHYHGGHHGEGGRGHVARHRDLPGAQLGPALDGDAAAVAVALDGDVGPEGREHALRVIAGGQRFGDRGPARRIQPRQQDRRLDLGRRLGRLIIDGHGRGRPRHRHRQAAAGAGLEASAHAPERLHHPLHGAPREGGIAGEHAAEPMAGDQPHEQPGPGARIAHVEDRGGLRQAADAAPEHPPRPAAQVIDRHAERAQGAGRPHHVIGFQEALDPGLAGGAGARDQGPVRDGLVAGHGGFTVERPGGIGFQRRHICLPVVP